MSLREQVEELFARGGEFTTSDREVFESFKQALNRGEVRAAERDPSGAWRVNSWVKRGILVGFRMGALAEMSAHASLRFFDKDTYPVRPTTIMGNVRIVPWTKPFNYAAVNNFGALQARGELLLFLNNDVEAINPDWLEWMVKHAQRPEAVSAATAVQGPTPPRGLMSALPA